ncbi:hypothetical protein TIFTF001_033432 [Ficus carica]|uniref:Uncharacterized protein n=1 Tax=Ficus carica TaxID=3494 RepID=A0AA88DYU5_FICCA|nr:hypothetical protein TIFTF001_033432 [Ficus carica]
MLSHVDILPTGESPCLAGITHSAAGGVLSGRPTKNGVDDVLGLRLFRPIAQP